jgi:hypothetical protein
MWIFGLLLEAQRRSRRWGTFTQQRCLQPMPHVYVLSELLISKHRFATTDSYHSYDGRRAEIEK